MVRVTGVVSCFILILAASAQAAQIDDLKADVEQLRREINRKSDANLSPISQVDAMAGNKYGPNAPVTTRNGKLQISGLIQIWYHHIQNDNVGIVKAADGNALDPSAGAFPGPEANELLDNDTFRVRRTELRFTMDIHENISAVVMIDPSREHNIQFSSVPTFAVHNAKLGSAALLQSGRGLQGGPTPDGGNLIIPQLLQDAYINFHGVVPHHDFTVGQFIPPAGEEAWRGNGYLDFVERAMVTSIAKVRDIGVMVHGTWWDDRFQYWAGVFNGPGGTVLTDPEVSEGGNRTDDNDEKDISWRVLVRPVWNKDCWSGRLELGYARTDGIRGESGAFANDAETINGLNRERTDINRQAAWMWYRPGGVMRGTWVRGEWGSGRDRYGGSIGSLPTSLLAIGGGVNPSIGEDFPIQLSPTPVTTSGWFAAAGYKMSDSRWAEGLRTCGGGLARALHDMEFAFRYESYENIGAEDLVNPDRHTDQFKTEAYTAGVNYYVKGYDAKIQANYIWVNEPSDGNPARGLREVRNDTFVVNFQVGF